MEREARAISALNHPNICHLYDIGSEAGTDFLVMEFLEGETLADRLGKGALPLAEVLRIGIAVAEALAFAHQHGIIHRDLKPGNIMLTKAGAKLMDFGLAKSVAPGTLGSPSGAQLLSAARTEFSSRLKADNRTMTDASPMTPLTTVGAVIGTIQYMSPEQIEGKPADARSDLFALGAVLYEMLTGTRPFLGKSQLSVASAMNKIRSRFRQFSRLLRLRSSTLSTHVWRRIPTSVSRTRTMLPCSCDGSSREEVQRVPLPKQPERRSSLASAWRGPWRESSLSY
jgi:eukaryotic-like serine/threonine-protein kinase